MPRAAGFFDSLARTLAVALIVALLATAVLWYVLQRGTNRTITAFFPTVVGLYVNNTVDMLGIPVGYVDEIVPQGPVVRVVLKVDNEVPVAADARAVIVAPTLVSDRYVQLGPSYTGGPMMSDGATIPVQRTGVPVELDAVYKSLDQLATSLGPNGANRAGALNQLLRSSANVLGGNGEAIKGTITELAGAVGTLSDNRANLFATVDNLGQFTNTLAANDGNVRALNSQLQDISGFLSSERGNLSQTLAQLPPALEQVNGFIRNNRDVLRTDVGQLAQVTDILVRQRQALTETLDVAPLALGNLTNVYNATSGTLDVRPVLAPGLDLDPRALVCGLLSGQQLQGAVNQLPVASELSRLASGAGVLCNQLFNPDASTVVTQALAPFQQLSALLGAPAASAAPLVTRTLGQATAPTTTLLTPGTGTATGQTPATPALPGIGILGTQAIGADR